MDGKGDVTAEEVHPVKDHCDIGIHDFMFGPSEGMEVDNSACRTSTASV